MNLSLMFANRIDVANRLVKESLKLAKQQITATAAVIHLNTIEGNTPLASVFTDAGFRREPGNDTELMINTETNEHDFKRIIFLAAACPLEFLNEAFLCLMTAGKFN